MHKLIAITLFAVTAVTARTAAAEQPCEGSSSTCTWTCSQDDQGNIINYSVTCEYGEYCVDAGGSVGFGTCDIVVDDDDAVATAMDELFALDEGMGALEGTCSAKTEGIGDDDGTIDLPIWEELPIK
ncbi:MAG: hypothetical protein R3A51_13600 [Nannocystaceae bacterium]|nr:hypothetical protein [Myxococcales bacterium]